MIQISGVYYRSDINLSRAGQNDFSRAAATLLQYVLLLCFCDREKGDAGRRSPFECVRASLLVRSECEKIRVGKTRIIIAHYAALDVLSIAARRIFAAIVPDAYTDTIAAFEVAVTSVRGTSVLRIKRRRRAKK